MKLKKKNLFWSLLFPNNRNSINSYLEKKKIEREWTEERTEEGGRKRRSEKGQRERSKSGIH